MAENVSPNIRGGSRRRKSFGCRTGHLSAGMVHAPEMHHVPLDGDAAAARAKIRKLIAENRAADEKPPAP
ncbi:MAG: hypothetical protein MI755_00895, partial [Sphingomonadales bacterium]|nr:hypothetical protein [Sphingomonadales bacterium]